MAALPWSLGTVTALAARASGGSVAALLPEPLPLPRIERKTTLTFRDLESVVSHGAAGLRREGVSPGDRVAIVVRSGLDGLLAALAAARAGATPAMLYGGLPRSELRPLVRHAGARVVLGPGPEGLAERLEAAGPEVVRPRTSIPETAILLYTSGTTGRPKGVPLSTRGLESALRFARLRPEVTIGREDHAVAVLPLAHVMGLILALAYLEARVPALFLPRFDAADVLEAIEATRSSVFAGVPGMYLMLDAAGADDRDLSSVRLWISGADAMPRELARRFQHRGSSLGVLGRRVSPAFFVDGYGLVEATGPALFRVLGPIGLMRKYRPLPGWRARAVDDDGSPVPAGAAGTLELSGPGVFRGYLDEAGGEREWLRTQDLATVSRLQAVEIVGRSADLMKVGGHRLHPGEIEDTLLEHPAVAEAGVAAVPHRVMGEVPAAAVVLKPGSTAPPEELTKWCADRLASYKVPRMVRVVDELPRTPTHKVMRRVLSETLADTRPA